MLYTLYTSGNAQQVEGVKKEKEAGSSRGGLRGVEIVKSPTKQQNMVIPEIVNQNIHHTDEYIQKIAKSFEQTKTLL